MDIIITHKSALEYWRLHGNEKIIIMAKTPSFSSTGGVFFGRVTQLAE